MLPEMIRISNVTVTYDEQSALQTINLQVPAGQCLLVTGPTGCGKSTLANLLTGLIPHALPARIQGHVWVAGMEVSQHSVAELAGSVGAVFQNPNTQLFHLRVDDEVSFGPRNLGWSEDLVRERVEWALSAVGLEGMEAMKPADLSGGQKQRLAIACVLVMKPRILVLDEPTASLDVPGTQQLIATLQALRYEQDLTIVLFEHRLAEVLRLVDRVVILDQGRIVADGIPVEVLSDRKMMRHLGLRRPTNEPPVHWDELVQPNGRFPQGVDPLLSLEAVHAGYGNDEVLHDVNLTLYPGEFVALVGDNGSGKSTLAQVAAGLIKPCRGKVRFRTGVRPKAGLDVALLFQDPTEQLLTDLVDEEVALGPRNFEVFQAAQHLQTLEETDLVELRHRRPITLSAGQQQRTALAACLALRPCLLILDEPTLGQDWAHMEQLMDFLKTLNQQGTTVLLITHDFKLVYRYAQRVILIEQGTISLQGGLRRNTDGR